MSATTDGSENGHSGCLFCGSLNPQSLKLSFRAGADGNVEGRFQSNAGLQGYDDLLHGGVIAGLLDAAMTHCLFSQGIQAVTGDLHVRFVRPVPSRAPLGLRARLLSSTPPLYRLKAELSLEGRMLAWGEATFMQLR